MHNKNKITIFAPSYYFCNNLLEYRVLDDPAYKDIAPEDVRQTAQEIRDFVRNGKPLPATMPTWRKVPSGRPNGAKTAIPSSR